MAELRDQTSENLPNYDKATADLATSQWYSHFPEIEGGKKLVGLTHGCCCALLDLSIHNPQQVFTS